MDGFPNDKLGNVVVVVDNDDKCLSQGTVMVDVVGFGCYGHDVLDLGAVCLMVLWQWLWLTLKLLSLSLLCQSLKITIILRNIIMFIIIILRWWYE